MGCNGPKIRQLRMRLGYSQERLAAIAGLDTKTVERAEKGHAGFKSINLMAHALGVPYEDIYTPEGRISGEPAPPPLIAKATTDRRTFLITALTASGVAFGGGWMIDGFNALAEHERRDRELMEQKHRLLFGTADTHYFVPAVNNRFSAVGGITASARDAIRSIQINLGAHAEIVELTDDPSALCARESNGTAVSPGGPVSNMHSRKLLGTGQGSPLVFATQRRWENFPVSFSNLFNGETGPGKRPTYELVVKGRKMSMANSDLSNLLLITSVPNFYSSAYGIWDHRLVNIAGLNGPGTRAIDLVLRDPDVVRWLWAETRSLTAWQALISVSHVDAATGKPLSLGSERRVFEISGVDFDRCHELLGGARLWAECDANGLSLGRNNMTTPTLEFV